MKHVIKVLDRGGDTEVVEWDPANKIEIKAAEDVFNELRVGSREKGLVPHLLYETTEPANTGQELKAFDPGAKEIVAIPQLVGG